ncbi:hypothetical protein D3870_02490 [Noviherbaspirillum cavernae]|uniref:Uncharacterized protein n=1 Tax=Noviherbaspirillum cavernae TaxID=2320862 RepID=A0A418WXR8_9BURK|nr:hypothetical protein [Noviherbaspirillum cavernae]RJG05034.1 hypothetical protein D3870_02490 [Noviherbaspirillum cavernae]
MATPPNNLQTRPRFIEGFIADLKSQYVTTAPEGGIRIKRKNAASDDANPGIPRQRDGRRLSLPLQNLRQI